MTETIYGIHPVREALTARGHRVREIWVSRSGQNRTVAEILAQARELGIKIRSHGRQRLDARAAKNWAEADRIRDELHEMGVELEDKDGKTIWRRS